MKIDIHTGTWLAVEAYVEGRLAELRIRLEGNLCWDETNAHAPRCVSFAFSLPKPSRTGHNM